ncbi:MAG: endonuclease/exonuclease/phosphatase family protein [Nocardioides sp.]
MSRKSIAAILAATTVSTALAVVTLTAPGAAHGTTHSAEDPAPEVDHDVRFATYNASLNRFNEGDLVRDLSTQDNRQAQKVAEIVQRTQPDVLLINEFDHVEDGRAAELFRDNYLEVSQNHAPPADYPYYYVAPSNTGVPSGHDLDNSGSVGGPNDAFGFGFFPGQFGMVAYSKYPIATDEVRTFQHFLWKDMPGALLPDDPATAAPRDWYSSEELEDFRLSSKSHWDVPVEIGEETVHVLASHPTPPVFDQAEDRNGTRNHDEIRFWADYVSGGEPASYIYDDAGEYGGLAADASFVIAGDQNSDPLDGDSIPGAIQQLLDNPRVNAGDPPTSAGASEASRLQGGINDEHRTPARYDTADFGDPPGNLRVDYVLPDRDRRTLAGAVYWPVLANPFSSLIDASDHRLVWVDVALRHRR